MLLPPLNEDPLVADWYERHRDPVSLVLHVVGIPFLVLAVVLAPVYLMLLSPRLFLLALGSFVLSYAIQFLGHFWDQTEPGEVAGLRRAWSRRARVRVATASASASASAEPLL